MRGVQGLMVFALGALAAGCAVGPNFHTPAPPPVRRYAAGPLQPTAAAATPGGEAQLFHPGEAVSGRWWQAFQAPQIDALVQQALAANPDLQAAQAALRAAVQTAAAQRGAYFPQLTLNASSQREQDPLTLSPTLSNGAEIFSLHAAEVDVYYPLDLFGANRRQVEALVAQAEQQRFQMEATYMSLVSNTIVAAITQATAQSELAAGRRMVQIENDSLSILRTQYRLGAVPQSAVSAQEAALAQVQAALPPLEQQRQQQHDLLAALTGRFPAQVPLEQLDLSQLTLPRDLPLSLPSQLVQQRPDVRSAQAQLHAATAQVGVAIANMLPNIALTADGGTTAVSLARLLEPGTRFWSLGGALSQTLFAGGTLAHRKSAAVATMDQAGAQYRSAVLHAFQEVADTLAALQADAVVLGAQTRAVNAASATLTVTRSNLQLGAASDLDLLAAELAYRQALAAQISARAARLTDTVALFEALGGGWWSPDAPQLPGARSATAR